MKLPRLMKISIEMEAVGGSNKNIDRHERPTRASLISTVFLLDNRDIPGAIITNALNCMDVDSWLSG